MGPPFLTQPQLDFRLAFDLCLKQNKRNPLAIWLGTDAGSQAAPKKRCFFHISILGPISGEALQRQWHIVSLLLGFSASLELYYV